MNTVAFSSFRSVALAVVERAHADERDPARVDRRHRQPLGLERGPARPSAAASTIPWTLPVGLVSGRFRSPCASTQSTPPGPLTRASPPSVPIATEWSPPRTSGSRPASSADSTLSATRAQAARISLEVAHPLVADRRRLGDGGLDVAEVDALAAELLDPRLEARVPDRRRTHVHAAAPGPEVEGGADDGDRRGCSRRSSPGNYRSGESGEGRNRTGDTTVFSRVLYQLSYLAAGDSVATLEKRTSGPVIPRHERPLGRERTPPDARGQADSERT